MKDDPLETATEIAAGLPPALSVADDRAELPEPNVRLNDPTAMELFFAWEKLRLVFNGVLAAVVFFMVIKAGFNPLAVVFLLWDAFIANACFCAGPVAEGYLCWFGMPRPVSRCLVCLLGGVVAIMMAVERTEEMLKMGDH